MCVTPHSMSSNPRPVPVPPSQAATSCTVPGDPPSIWTYAIDDKSSSSCVVGKQLQQLAAPFDALANRRQGECVEPHHASSSQQKRLCLCPFHCHQLQIYLTLLAHAKPNAYLPPTADFIFFFLYRRPVAVHYHSPPSPQQPPQHLPA